MFENVLRIAPTAVLCLSHLLLALAVTSRPLPAQASGLAFDALLGDADDSGTVSIGEVNKVVNNFLGATNLLTVECKPDMVRVGSFCVDKYEASVWRIPNPSTTNAPLVKKVQYGTATAADLAAGGATLLGAIGDNYAPCNDNGQNCANDIYAVSLAGTFPSAYITWFQAQQACNNAKKRLPSNAEWQQAVAGSPDPGEFPGGATSCNSHTTAVSVTGSRSSCVSSYGAFDMVGNLWEWVADWAALTGSCGTWGLFNDDLQCFTGVTYDTLGPGALVRGGGYGFGGDDGPLAISAENQPQNSYPYIGFRCAR